MDECRNEPCGIGAQCTNIPGGYKCSCAPGFEKNPALPSSLFGTIHSAQQQQVHQEQSQLAGDNSTFVACLDVNECQKVGGANLCGLNAQCVNTAGAYFCQCPPNYTGNPKVSCQDIDECQNHGCGPNALCKNLPGFFKCECKQGYSGKLPDSGFATDTFFPFPSCPCHCREASRHPLDDDDDNDGACLLYGQSLRQIEMHWLELCKRVAHDSVKRSSGALT